MKKLFELEWNAGNNPNGWVEPTTFCNLQCPGCYRGCDKENYQPVHVPLQETCEQVDWHIQHRNIQTLSIAGGEPLLYPYLDQLVSYATGKGLHTMIYTNGIGLGHERLQALKEAGATKIVIHVDEYQERVPHHDPDALIELRQQYCQLFRQVKGIGLGFIQPLAPSDLEKLHALNHFFAINRDVISLVVFTLYREIQWDHAKKPAIDTSLTMQQALGHIEGKGFMKASSYLKATGDEKEPAWVFSHSIGTREKNMGFVSPAAAGFIQKRYFKKHGRHLFISRTHGVKRSSLFKLLPVNGFFKIFFTSLFHKGPFYYQSWLMIRGPVLRDGEWDLCQGCPDAMLHGGKLVPSCILENIKNKE